MYALLVMGPTFVEFISLESGKQLTYTEVTKSTNQVRVGRIGYRLAPLQIIYRVGGMPWPNKRRKSLPLEVINLSWYPTIV